MWSFLKQLIDYAKLRNDYLRNRANPVTPVPAPAQMLSHVLSASRTSDIVEKIRADFLELETLFQAGVHRAREDR